MMLTMTIIGICTQGSAAQDFTNELVCYSGSRYYEAYDCKSDKLCYYCSLCPTWVVSDLYDEHVEMLHGNWLDEVECFGTDRSQEQYEAWLDSLMTSHDISSLANMSSLYTSGDPSVVLPEIYCNGTNMFYNKLLDYEYMLDLIENRVVVNSPVIPPNPNNNGNNNNWKVGSYLKPKDCEEFFKDSLLIMRAQDDSTDCVSASLTYNEMWQRNYPIEKYDSVKKHIEDNFEDKYDRPLKESGVKDYEFAEFVKIHSGINAQSVSLNQLKAKLKEGNPAITSLVIKGGSGDQKGHSISLIGYDCKDNYLYIDPVKKSLQKCTDEELMAFGKATGNTDCLFYIYKDLQ